ncbi:zinc finger CCCH domain-containing protein 46-like [Silene latifolia]|uniref:zinc finger CCCH domain-containing protein 46-like n=1 Tax=Silene latifolia TaxID=37657 RepID=UPI003D7810C9
MESYEASRLIFSRIQNIDPENASKIMGYILLNHEQNDIIHLAYGPETLIISLVKTAKIHLGLSSNTLSASPVNPISNPISISRPDPLSIPVPSSRMSNGFDSFDPFSPSIWSPNHISSSPKNSKSFDFSYVNDDYPLKNPNFDPFLDDPLKNLDFFEQNLDLPYLEDCSSSTNGGRNSCFNGENLGYVGGVDDSSSGFGSGFGFKPCMYYTRGFCKNGGACNFVHDDVFEHCQEEIIRSKLAYKHRLAAQLMANNNNNINITNGGCLPFNKLNFLPSDAQRSAASLMMSEDFHKMTRMRMARFTGMDCDPSSRQIYLTFPADSTFKEEDVSTYFNKFGPVQDVRIPYQQKRMFGFVTFVFPETVRIILAKGNPHFVCDSRVLVKPYKEKGKLPDKRQHQHQFERGEYSCSSPSEHDYGDPYDIQLGERMLYGPQEMLLRKKLEDQAEFQHALELQERRLMNLKLLDLENQQHRQNISVGSPILSPNMLSQGSTNQFSMSPSNDISKVINEETKESQIGVIDDLFAEGVNPGFDDSNGGVPNKEGSSPTNEKDEHFESLSNVLQDNLFAAPSKSSSDSKPASFSPALAEFNNAASDNDSTSPATAYGDSTC